MHITHVLQDKCMQASASQDILTLMKEWRIEATDTGDPRPSGETSAPAQARNDSQNQTVTK